MLAYRCDNTNHVGSSSEGQIEHSACMLFGVGWVDWWGQAIRLNLFRPSRDGMGGGGGRSVFTVHSTERCVCTLRCIPQMIPPSPSLPHWAFDD